jgi:hypothetical protein
MEKKGQKPPAVVVAAKPPDKPELPAAVAKKTSPSMQAPVQLELKKLPLILNQGCKIHPYLLLVLLTAKVIPLSSDIIVGMGDGRVLVVDSQTHKTKEVARCTANK